MSLLDSTTSSGPRPRKGQMFELNADISNALIAYHDDVVPALGAVGSIDELLSLLETKEGWEAVTDDFGRKVYFASGEIRLTLVKTARNGDLMVDIRIWN